MADSSNPVAWTTLLAGSIYATEDEATLRREFLRLLGMLGAVAAYRRGALIAAVAGEVDLDWTLVESLHWSLRALGSQWDRLPPAQLFEALHGLQLAVDALTPATSGPLRQECRRISAEAAVLLGLVSRFRGALPTAGSYLALAELLAVELGDTSTQALALIYQSDLYSEVQRGGPGGEPARARALLARAESLIGDEPSAAPAVRSLLLLRQAEEHAALRHPAEAYEYVERADSALAVALPGRTVDLIGIGWTTTIQDAFRGNVSLLCGKPEDAIVTLEGVLRRYEPEAISNRAAALADLGAAQARRGNMDAACDLLATSLLMAHRAGLVDRVERVAGLRQRELADWNAEPLVMALDEAISGCRVAS